MTFRERLMFFCFFLTFSFILVSVSTAASAQELDHIGEIQGQVNLVDDPLPDQSVSLHKLQNSTWILVANATTDENGNYTFENLNLEERYEVSLNFQGVPYSKTVNFNGETSVQIGFTVYNTTTSDANMKIQMANLVVIFEEDGLRIFEDCIYRNAGLRVFNNSQLRAWLPSETSNFKTSIMDCCVQRTGNKVLLDPMDPIKPNGTYYMWLEYNLTISSSQQQLEKELAYDTEQFYLIIENEPGVTMEITAGLENKSRTVRVDNVEYTVFNGTNLKGNSTIKVMFTGLPIPPNYGPVLLWVLIPLILGIGVFTYPIIRKKASQPDLESKKSMAYEALAKLDSEYAAGKIPEDKYERLRSKYKKKAITMIQQIEKTKPIQSHPSKARPPVLAELHAEEQALISTLHELELNYKKRLVSEESYRKMRLRFESRRTEVIKKIRELETTANKNENGSEVDS